MNRYGFYLSSKRIDFCLYTIQLCKTDLSETILSRTENITSPKPDPNPISKPDPNYNHNITLNQILTQPLTQP